MPIAEGQASPAALALTGRQREPNAGAYADIFF